MQSAGRTSAQQLGDAAESHVAALLDAAGWSVVARNVHVGRAELDLIAIDPGSPPALVVVEVRWRSGRGLRAGGGDRRPSEACPAPRGGLALARGARPPDPAPPLRPRDRRARAATRSRLAPPPPSGRLLSRGGPALPHARTGRPGPRATLRRAAGPPVATTRRRNGVGDHTRTVPTGTVPADHRAGVADGNPATRSAEERNRQEVSPRAVRLDAAAARSRCPLRSPDPPLEPQDAPVHLRGAQRDPHHRSRPDRQAPRRRPSSSSARRSPAASTSSSSARRSRPRSRSPRRRPGPASRTSTSAGSAAC